MSMDAWEQKWKRTRRAPHGLSAYKTGCRCSVCTEANRLAARQYRAVHGTPRTPAQLKAERKYEQKRARAGRARTEVKALGLNVVVLGVRRNTL